MLLFEQGKQAEFVDCGLEMLSYFFRSVYYMKSLRGYKNHPCCSFYALSATVYSLLFILEICLYSDRKTRSETRRKLLAQGRKGEGEGGELYGLLQFVSNCRLNVYFTRT